MLQHKGRTPRKGWTRHKDCRQRMDWP